MSSDPDASTTSVIARTKTIAVAAIELQVIAGPERGTSLSLAQREARIGTASGNTLKLTDPTVSRMHCELQASSEGVRITDLGSTNGTFVNGVQISDATLSAGSVITLGATSVRVEIGSEPAHVRLSDRDRFGDVLGSSVEMRRVFAIMEKVSATDSTVLIHGETGTGKEVVARAIHEASARAAAPFVVVDCGAITENLIESELFGHTRGSFSGAVTDRKGLFAEASGGTLFLDEIGELPVSMQPKLLRALETKHIRRVGENAQRVIDVRVLAATNRSLANSVNDGSFREDLYYRLAVVEIHLPPLRSRREDIPSIARHFHERMTDGTEPISDEFIASLMARSWPGNVRELRNCIERAICLGAGRGPSPPPTPSVLPPGFETLVPVDLPFKDARAAWMDRFETVYVTALLRKTGGNVTRAAELAGLHRRTLQRILASLGIRANDDP